MSPVEIILSVWNTVVFVLYGIDKLKARKGAWRISEATLILPAFFFAGVGALLGMVVFNHKTSKTKFRVLIPLAFVINLAAVIFTKYYTR